MEKLNEIIFYTMDKAIKTYRMFAQQQLREAGYKITIDQWLIIKGILENPDISQLELGEKAFKDNASVTRIIDLLVKAAYLERQFHETDRRRVKLIVTQAGIDIVSNVQKVVLPATTSAGRTKSARGAVAGVRQEGGTEKAGEAGRDDTELPQSRSPDEPPNENSTTGNESVWMVSLNGMAGKSPDVER